MKDPESTLASQNPAKRLSIAAALTAVMLVWLGWNAFHSYQAIRSIQARVFRIEELRGTIIHLDEVLTMSARMAAASNDLRWELRYREFEPQLTAAIEEATRLSPEAGRGSGAAQTEAANTELVKMEDRAFNLVRVGRLAEANAILSGQAYEKQKRIYAEGLAAFSSQLRATATTALHVEQNRAFVNLVIILIVLPALLVTWGIILRTLHTWRDALSERARQLGVQAQALTDLNTTLDLKVAARTGELESARIEALKAKEEAERSSAELRAEMTERRRTQEALQESETTLSGFYMSSPMMMGIVDISGDAVMDVSDNGAARVLRGRSAAHGDSSESLTAEWIAHYRESGRTGRPVRFEYPYENGHGRQWLSVTVCEISRGRNGTSRFSYVGEDITERKRTEEDLENANKRLGVWVEELETRDREANLLNELIGFLQACHSPDEGFNVLNRFIPRLFPGTSGGVSIISPSRDVLETAVVWGQTPPADQVFAPDDCWALRRGLAYQVEDTGTGLVCRHVTLPMSEGYMCLPMMASSDTLGILHLRGGPWMAAAPNDHKRLRDGQFRMAAAVAEHIAPALANLRLRETLRTQAIRDPITGLFNRRYMEESVDRELHRASRSGALVMVIMLDLDHFRQFNDTFGQAAGNALLRELGQYLRQSVRAEDIACRYGGEEFTLILSGGTLQIGLQRAEELREGARHLTVQHRGVSAGGVTVSMGVAFFPEHGRTSETLIRTAEEALERAKAEGRNRVVTAQVVAEPAGS